MSNYLKRLGETTDEKKTKVNKAAEAHAKATVQKAIAGFQAQSSTLELAYEAALGENPFNFQKVFGLTKEIADNEAALELAETILETEFEE